jgi:hypothetical protein
MEKFNKFAERIFNKGVTDGATHQPMFQVILHDDYWIDMEGGKAIVNLHPMGYVTNGRKGFLAYAELPSFAFHFHYDRDENGNVVFPYEYMKGAINTSNVSWFNLVLWGEGFSLMGEAINHALENEEFQQNHESFVAWLESKGWVKHEQLY